MEMVRQRLGLSSSVLLPMWRAHGGDRLQPFLSSHARAPRGRVAGNRALRPTQAQRRISTTTAGYISMKIAHANFYPNVSTTAYGALQPMADDTAYG
jgi:hypothetical protein